MNPKLNKIKAAISNLFGIKEWKLRDDGKLDMDEDLRSKMMDLYGEKFVEKFEKSLKEESDTKIVTKKKRTDMSKANTMALLCAVLAVESLEMTDEGLFLNQEQLNLIEGELAKMKDLRAQKEAADKDKKAADQALIDASAALDDLDETVAKAETVAAKVEAVRAKLAEKPGAAPTGTQSESDLTHEKIEGADDITAFAGEYL